jgi:hypothetical protein
MLRMPSASIPTMVRDHHQAKLTYSFLSNPHVKHDALLSGHFLSTAQRCAQERTVLLIADTSDLDYSTHRKVRGLGLIMDPWSLGMLMHTTLAVAADQHQVLGVLDQFVWAREGPSKQSRKESSYARKHRRRESERWRAAVSRVHELLHRLNAESIIEPTRYLVIGDREADNFDLFLGVLGTDHGFVFRVYHNRRLIEDDTASPRYLIEEVLRQPVVTTKTVVVPARAGVAARLAKLEVRAMQASIAPPKSSPKNKPVKANLVSAVEIDALNGVEPISWHLLTSEPVETPEQVLQVIQHYEARWLIEELHMGIKTGCATEERQFESRHAIENFLAFAVVTAVTLLRLRDVARRPVPIPAVAVLSPTQVEILHKLRPKLMKDGTARVALRAIATLGGFMGRKGDGEPGWRTLWRGFQILLITEQGYSLGRNNTS